MKKNSHVSLIYISNSSVSSNSETILFTEDAAIFFCNNGCKSIVKWYASKGLIGTVWI